MGDRSREDLDRTLRELFAPLEGRERFVVGQLGQSLDGRIATEQGHSHYINGPEDRVRLHRLRSLCHAVVVGSGTVASDDPQLTVREVEGANPVRVVLDPDGGLDPGRGVFTDGAAPTIWVRRTAPAGPEAAASPGEAGAHAAGVEVVDLPCDPERGFAPDAIIDFLARRGLTRILVEGGGVTVSRFLAVGALDRLHLVVAPLLLGSGRPSLTLAPIETLDQALRPPVRRYLLGDDVLFDLDLSGSA